MNSHRHPQLVLSVSQWAADEASLLRREFDLARQELLEALLVNATRPPAPTTGIAK